MASLTDLSGSAQVLLDAFIAELTALGVDLPTDSATGLPVTYVAPGIGSLFAWDQPCLALSLDAIQQGTPGKADQSNVNAWALTFSATFSLVLLRDVATLNDGTVIPDASALTADAARLLPDASALLQAAVQVKLHPPDWDRTQEPLVIHQVLPVGPDGGLGGNALQFTVPLA